MAAVTICSDSVWEPCFTDFSVNHVLLILLEFIFLLFKFYFIFKLYIIVSVLPNIKMNPLIPSSLLALRHP